MTRARRVALNALFLAPGVSGGPETYLRGLVPPLASRHPELRLALVTTVSGARVLCEEGWDEWLEVVALPCEDGQRLRRTVAEQVWLPLLARRRGWQLVHSLASVAPVRALTRSVITLHDLTFMSRPTFGRLTTFGMAQVISRATAHADELISGSEAARDDVCRELGIDPGRVTVIPHGAGRAAVGDPVSEDVLRLRYGLTGSDRVVLCPAAKRPHKNQEVLIRAMTELDDLVLVLAGHPESYEAQLRELAQSTGVAGRVRFVDYVPDSELEGLYALASCVAFPTRGEGFGLPVVEAMARGVPVACSSIPVLREVGGDAATYFDCDDASGAARAIRVALDNEQMAAAGRERAHSYSWEAAADRTCEVYERCLAGHD
jgi:glycosyltransferase involved in cell wall biosynthesis